ncbi:hypothetical protein NAEGRDRAFT_64523 [Naegleria gruberi]|uniref:F-box domain-containing protein n=1 Tax=Naegleria gruberi TaxID=5762 RepID=D2V6Q4_NAEGR|nr:uncharacterized protein NAEGRDRAFT_64523 [Naegleria gruberi]EFC47480.1 hypothetical protein NAEGRDRAFT_64523 [Naegleria gruberi]|eukprot:XP_002680224.1 hypothetical protein NAEGRDRAFT_64523 [Naegleria gruberi strain NEG-M]
MLELPDEILLTIFLMIEDDDKTWRSLMLTCKSLKTICYDYRYQMVNFPKATIKLYQGKPNQYYISLVQFDTNYSTYKIPHRMDWPHPGNTDVITRWFKLRVDPKTMLIHTSDYRFTRSTGRCSHHPESETQIPYASCFGCESPGCDDAKACCDLTGTRFKFNAKFHHDGCASNGSWKFEKHNKKIKLTGGGYCGWTTPLAAKTEIDAVLGGWYVGIELD